MIHSLAVIDALLEDVELKVDHHVFVDVPFEGGRAALEYQENNDHGYGFLAYLHEEHPTLEITDVPKHKQWEGGASITQGHDLLGDMWEFYDEGNRVTWHFVYTHSIEFGHFPLWYRDGTDSFIEKLTDWWDAHEEDIPFRGVHAVMFGHGHYHAEVGDYRALKNLLLGIQAGCDIQFHLFTNDPNA